MAGVPGSLFTVKFGKLKLAVTELPEHLSNHNQGHWSGKELHVDIGEGSEKIDKADSCGLGQDLRGCRVLN